MVVREGVLEEYSGALWVGRCGARGCALEAVHLKLGSDRIALKYSETGAR
jgi:hypothetical protein